MLKNRIVGHGNEAPDQLLANPANWRVHPVAQQDELEKVLEAVGWVQQVIVNRRTQHIVDGHLRVLTAMKRHEETVPVTYIDVSPAEEKLILLTFDPLAALATRDDEKLDVLLGEVAVEFLDAELDFDAILDRPKTRTKGLTHTVHACTCCQKKCRKGCGCYEET